MNSATIKAMRRLPPLTALRAFEAAARYLSFKAAADELGLTPTAISHQVKLLEKALARPLFRRRPRPLTLTPVGATLFPIIRDGLDAFAQAVAIARDGTAPPKLRVTTTNAFAARWLLPRLPVWRAAHPEIIMEVIGTDAVIDLARDDADVAVRYAFAPPPGLVSTELIRDRFWPVASPKLLSSRKSIETPSDLANYTFIHSGSPATEIHAPTWGRWIAMARHVEKDDLALDVADDGLMFREEAHAIDAVIAGQGVGLLSDVLIQRELASGELVKLLDLALPGFGFYLVYTIDHPRPELIGLFSEWISSAR